MDTPAPPATGEGLPSFAFAPNRVSPLDKNKTYRKTEEFKAAAIRHFRSSPSLALLHKPYRTMFRSANPLKKAVYDYPMGVVENQCDAQKNKEEGRNPYVANQMEQMSRAVFAGVEQQDAVNVLTMAEDAALAGATNDDECVPNRDVDFFAKKWMIAHDGSVGERIDRKVESERLGTMVMDRFKGAARWRTLLMDALAQRPVCNRHDMTDAFLVAMQRLLNAYAAVVAKVLGRRRPHEQRSDFAVLTPEQMNFGTLRALGVDPGTRNKGVCLLELVGMRAPPEGVAAITRTNSPLDPDPVFRILCWELVDLDTPWSDIRGHARLSSFVTVAAQSPLIEPDYETDNRKLDAFFKPVVGGAADAVTTVAPTPKKRKRISDEDGEPDVKRRRRVAPTPTGDHDGAPARAVVSTSIDQFFKPPKRKRDGDDDDEPVQSRRTKRRRVVPAASTPPPPTTTDELVSDLLLEDETVARLLAPPPDRIVIDVTDEPDVRTD